MNPIVEKQAAMDKIIKKYALLPKSIEVSNKNKELVFTFEHLGHAQCDHYSVQKELRTIFDFSKSVSVVIPEAETQPVVSREAILKKAAAAEAPAVPKAAEAEEKSSPSLIAQRMSKVMETNSQIITFQGNPTPAEPAPQKQGWTGGGRGRGRADWAKKSPSRSRAWTPSIFPIPCPRTGKGIVTRAGFSGLPTGSCARENSSSNSTSPTSTAPFPARFLRERTRRNCWNA